MVSVEKKALNIKTLYYSTGEKMKKTAIITFALILTFAMLTLLLLNSISSVQAGSWYTINNNSYFNSAADWTGDIWYQPNNPSHWHTYYISGGVAYTRFAGWQGINQWGNTEYEQGTDFYGLWGTPFTPIPLTVNQQVVVRGRVTEKHIDSWFGVVDMYVDLWVHFSEPTGTYGLTDAELLIYVSSLDGWLYPWHWPNTYGSLIASADGFTWYNINYRIPADIGSGWTTRTLNVNDLISRLNSVYGCDLSKGVVRCLSFGIEGAQGEMAAEWDYVKYQVRM